jgi:hypothetical protein
MTRAARHVQSQAKVRNYVALRQPVGAIPDRSAKGDGSLTHKGPDPAPDRFQAEAVLVLRPDLDRLSGVLSR